MYKLFVFTSDEKWVQLHAEWKLGEVLTFAVHWFRNRDQDGHYRLDTFKVMSGDEDYIHFQLGTDVLG